MEQENLSARNRRSGQCCLAARGRVPRGRNRGGQSTARHRGGPVRSSDEGAVMAVERRSGVIQSYFEANQLWEEPYE